MWKSWSFVANPRAYTSSESCIVLLSFGILVNHRIRQNRKINRCSFQSLDVSLRPDRPPDAQTIPGQRQRPDIQRAWVAPNPGTTEIAVTGWQVSPRQTFANTKIPVQDHPVDSPKGWTIQEMACKGRLWTGAGSENVWNGGTSLRKRPQTHHDHL